MLCYAIEVIQNDVMYQEVSLGICDSFILRLHPLISITRTVLKMTMRNTSCLTLVMISVLYPEEEYLLYASI